MSQSKTPAAQASKNPAAKRAAAQPSDDSALLPAKPADYEPEGEVKVLAESKGVRVVADDVRVWKERAK